MKKLINNVDMFIIIMFAAYYCLPIVFVRVPFYVMLLAMIVYIALTAITNFKVLQEILLSFCSILVINSLLYLVGDVRTIEMFISKTWSLCTCFFPVYLLYRLKLQPKDNQKVFLLSCSIMFSITLSLTFVELLRNPSACRDFFIQTELYQRNIGHFDFIYACVVVVLLCLNIRSIYKERNRAAGVVIVSIWAIFIFVTILQSQYTLALLTIIIIWLYSYFLNQQNSKEAFLNRLIGVVLLVVFLPLIFRGIISIIPSEKVSQRLSEVFAFLFEGDATGSNFSGRIELYIRAIQDFFEGFFTGNRHAAGGAHSSFLSIASHTGIWGVIVLIFLCYRSKKQVWKLLDNSKREISFFKPAYLAWLITGFTNPVLNSYLLCFVVFCCFPLCIRYFKFDNKTLK